MTLVMRISMFCLMFVLGATWRNPMIAQDDFRSVDDGRPLRVEDAYPIKFLEWEWELGLASALAEGGRNETGLVAELKTGFARNWQIGIETHTAIQRTSGISQTGIEEFGAHLLYNINQEGPVAPAIAFRADVMTPGVGDVARNDVSTRLRGMATRSFGLLRVHGNTSYTWASGADGDDYWSAGLAFDRPLGLNGRAVVGDVYVESPTNGGDTRLWVDLGGRMQVSKILTFDFGITSRLDEWADGVPNIGFTVGLARMFGIPGLVKVPQYPNPRLND